MISPEEFKKACGKFDLKKCKSLLDGVSIDEKTLIPTFIEKHVRLSGCLIKKSHSKEKQALQQKFITYCRSEISKSNDSKLISRFDQHIIEAAIVERGYQEILKTLKETPAGKLPPNDQVWAAIGRAVREIQLVLEQSTGAFSANEGILDVMSPVITGADGERHNPDSIINNVTHALGDTILMLAYENGWISNQKLVIPNIVMSDEDSLLKSGTTAYLGMVWKVLKTSEEQLRYFGGELNPGRIKALDHKQTQQDIEAFIFDLESEDALIEEIANERLKRAQLSYAMSLEFETDAYDKISKSTSKVPLAPNGYISRDEILTFLTIGDLFCYPVESDKEIFNGLSLKHWIRGYAVLKEKLLKKDESSPLELRTFTTTELTEVLEQYGLSSKQANNFIETLRFSPSRNDLFNTPLLRGSDDAWHFFAPAYVGANLSEIIISLLSANGIQIKSKGKQFEKNTLDLLTEHGLNAKTFNYTLGDEQFECDAVFIWNEKLFVVECKNYGLSGMNTISSYYFSLKMKDARKQVQRISRQLNENSEIVKRHLGENAKWSETVSIVLNAMPWSVGKVDGTYFYDSSALRKFFNEGHVSFEMPIRLNDKVVVKRRHKVSLWAGEEPTSHDFLHQLNNPIQVEALKGEWEWGFDPQLPLLSKNLAIVRPFWKRKDPDHRRTLKAYGLSDQEISDLLENFNEVHANAMKLKAKYSDECKKDGEE
ncbi:NERD domain-containing protein [Coraliomargarita algicola]|uniref:NERD domain-containing protein n=1 Tax=Coraliomargarita algicola TaxID=3092156 RepID=A0ABZ0RMS9_9BACT|nr:NERD domain-containing protein [Coraliomargarita sp. J2-16]WPJ97530.1 NERD domain-containing protein [Coraliomargarita sp. J2-16]